MSYRFDDMRDDELVMHYRDMQHLTVDVSTSKGMGDFAYYQGIVREMARRFAIRVENEEVEDEQSEDM